MLESACRFGLLDIVTKLLNPATWSAVAKPPRISYFLKASAGLQIAAFCIHVDVVQLLIRHGAGSTAKLSSIGRRRVSKECFTLLQAMLRTVADAFSVRSVKNRVKSSEEYLKLLDVPIHRETSEEDLQTCLELLLSADSLERAFQILRRSIKILSIPRDTMYSQRSC